MQHVMEVFAKVVELLGIELGGEIDEVHRGFPCQLTYDRVALGNVIEQVSLQFQRI